MVKSWGGFMGSFRFKFQWGTKRNNIATNLYCCVVECDGTGEPNVEPQVRECLRYLIEFTFITFLQVLFMIMITFLNFVA